MKILHVIDSLSMGGAENLVAQLASQQAMLGHDVRVVQLVSPNSNVLCEHLTESNVESIILSRNTPYNPLLSLKLIKHIRWAEIVHVHLFPALYWVACAKCLIFPKARFVYTEHSTQNKRRNHPIWHLIDKIVYRRYNVVVACADKVLSAYCKAFPTIESISIPNGVDVDFFAKSQPYTKRELLNINENSFVATMVARFCYPKRQDVIIKAMRFLPDNFHLVFVGTGEKIKDTQELSKQLNLDGRIHFLGVRSDVSRILKTSDVVIMSSEYEGLSLSSLEGMAAGKPLIATNVNGLREIVEGYGVLFDVNSPDELAGILNKFMTDSNYYHAIKDACTTRAMQFDIRDVVRKYITVYNEL